MKLPEIISSTAVIFGLFIQTAPAIRAQTQPQGIWMSRAEILALPMSGKAWENVKNEADRPVVTPDLSNQDDKGNIRALAKALVYSRTGDPQYYNDAREMVFLAMGTEDKNGGDVLGLVRNVGAVIIAADLIGLGEADHQKVVDWLTWLRPHVVEGRYSIETASEQRPNNWGGHANFSRLVLDAYIGDWDDFAGTASLVRSFMGEPELYPWHLGKGWVYGSDLSWQPDPNKPVGIVPKGVLLHGHDVSGMIPDDQRRCGSFQWPPCKTGYLWETLQGWIAAAVVLHRYGYKAFEWSDQAMKRALEYLHNTTFSDGKNYPAEGDDTWLPHLINYYYGTNYPAPVPSNAGKNMGFTDWTHGTRIPDTGENVTVNVTIEGVGQVEITPSTGPYKKGTNIILKAVPDSAWRFSNWGGDLTGADNPAALTLNSDKNIVAVFTRPAAKKYALNVIIDGAGTVSLLPAGGVYDFGTVVELTAHPGSGSVFNGWGGDLAGSANPQYLTINADKSVSAFFSALEAGDTLSSIGGAVLHATSGLPIPRAIASLLQNGTELTKMTTDTLGRFDFQNLSAGNYILMCSKTGFESKSLEIPTAPGQHITDEKILLTPMADKEAPQPPANVQAKSVNH